MGMEWNKKSNLIIKSSGMTKPYNEVILLVQLFIVFDFFFFTLQETWCNRAIFMVPMSSL